MKIAFITRSTLFSDPGGDSTQVEQTALHLRKLGVQVDIKLTAEPIEYEKYDLLHFFNIIRPADILHHVEVSPKPFVISTIFVDYSEYEKNNRKGIIGVLSKLVGPDTLEYLKAIARFVVNGEKIRSKSYVTKGHFKSIQFLAQKASLLLPNSLSEYQRLANHYKIQNDFAVIPNAVDPKWLQGTPTLKEEFVGKVICVARIEGRKNQYNLIKAVKGTTIELAIIGEASPNHKNYLKACQTEAGPNVTFLGHVAGQELYDIFYSAKVHVLPSFFETTGLSTLEAALMGCQVVITDKGDTVEYFGEDAFYCDPQDPQSIKAALEAALAAPLSDDLQNKILQNYTWDITAIKTLEAYKKVLQI